MATGRFERWLAGVVERWTPEARRDRRIRDQIRRATRRRLRDAPEATAVCVLGTVRPFARRLLEAPLTGRLCVYYAVRIDEVRPRGELDRELGGASESLTFALEDRGELAIVDPAHAHIAAACDHESSSLAAFDADERQRALLVDRGLIDRDWFNTAGLRYRETVIMPDEAVAVLGAATREPDPERAPGAYRDTPTRLRFAGSTRHPLAICDRPEPR